MSWGPELTTSETAAVAARKTSLSSQADGYEISLERLENLETQQQTEKDADFKLFTWADDIIQRYELEFQKLHGRYRANSVYQNDLRKAAEGQYDTLLFPFDYEGPYQPKLSIPELGKLINFPARATEYDLGSEGSMAQVLIQSMLGVNSYSGAAEPGRTKTQVDVTASTTLISVVNAAVFTNGDWAVLVYDQEDELLTGTTGEIADDATFGDVDGTFLQEGVIPGDTLTLASGSNTGDYPILDVVSNKELLVAGGSFGTYPESGISWSINRNTGAEMAVVEISGVDLVADELTVTVSAITGTGIVHTGAVISSNKSSFERMILQGINTLVDGLNLEVGALTAISELDNYSDGSVVANNAQALEQAQDTYDLYKTWVDYGATVVGSGNDGATPAVTTFTSASALFQTWGVQPGYTLNITSGVNQGAYVITAVNSETNISVDTSFDTTGTSGEDWIVTYGNRYDDAVLDELRLRLDNRGSFVFVRYAQIITALVDGGLYNNRKDWVDSLVNRASGSWTALESTQASIVSLTTLKGEADNLLSAYEGYTGQ